jgi:hypothetical protein
MTLSRRRMLRAAAGIAAAPILCAIGKAHGYPSRPVRFVVPFPPGGVSDIIARLIGQKLSERLGQPFVIEDRGGAGSNLGTETVVRAPADGHTLLLDGSANAVNASFYPNLSFNYLRDIAPVASMFRAPHIIEVQPSFPAETVAEFIAYAKAHPGRIISLADRFRSCSITRHPRPATFARAGYGRLRLQRRRAWRRCRTWRPLESLFEAMRRATSTVLAFPQRRRRP